MSARLELQMDLNKTTLEQIGGKHPSETEVESLFRNFDAKDLVEPLRKVRSGEAAQESFPAAEQKRKAALNLQGEWEALLVQRELLANEIKRGREFLAQTQSELRSLRARLEDWPAYERVCGKNPIVEYMESIAAHERVQEYLPAWIERREVQLRKVRSQVQRTARKNGLQHLL